MRAERVKGYTQLVEGFLPHPHTVFPIACHPPPPPPPAGKRVVKIKSLSSNCSLPEEHSPKHLCWTISWGLAQTFGILHAGREKPPGTAFLKGPLSLPCSSDQLHTPPLDPAHLWGKMLPTNGQVTKNTGCQLFESCWEKGWPLNTILLGDWYNVGL